jgi:hypothetical protein
MGNKIGTNATNLIAIEKEIRNDYVGIISKAKLRSKLKNIKLSDFNNVIKYLELSNQIYVGTKGIVWIQNDNKKLRGILSDCKRKGRIYE